MEMTVCFLLLLLLCSPSTAQLQSQSDNDVAALGEPTVRQTRETTDASNQGNTGLIDLQAFLKELKTSLAEQKEEIGRLKTENEAQEAKLRELESQKAEVEKLKQNLEVTRVAFTAALLTSGSQTLGPSDTLTPLVFKHVISNIGNAYSSDTGVFTAPVKGAYHFVFYVTAYMNGDQATAAGLMKNGESVLITYEHQSESFGSSGNSATLLLEVGDVVSVSQWYNTLIFDNHNHRTTFSGHLLFTM